MEGKSNWYAGFLGTWNVRFIPNLIFTLNSITKNYLDWLTGSDNFHTSQINKLYMNEEGIKVSARPILVLTCLILLFVKIKPSY